MLNFAYHVSYDFLIFAFYNIEEVHIPTLRQVFLSFRNENIVFPTITHYSKCMLNYIKFYVK